jgi:hypothetical protein
MNFIASGRNVHIILTMDQYIQKYDYIHDIHIQGKLYAKFCGHTMPLCCCVRILKASVTKGDKAAQRSWKIRFADWPMNVTDVTKSFQNPTFWLLSLPVDVSTV